MASILSAAESPENKHDEAPKRVTGPTWPEIPPDDALSQFLEILEDVIIEADYDEVFGICLRGATSFQQKLILQKFLRANANDLGKARIQLLETLKWRKSFQPLKAMEDVYNKKRFHGLGYIISVDGIPATFNIYGSVSDNAATFSDIDGFIRWRVGMMELSLQQLNLQKATTPIPTYGAGPDPYQCLQVHDYLSVSFLRQDPHAKAAAKRAIEVFQSYYPETLSRKLFVNVPVIMGWMFSAMRLVLSKDTVNKFTVVTYAKDLATELGQSIPHSYGGSRDSLEVIGQQLKMGG